MKVKFGTKPSVDLYKHQQPIVPNYSSRLLQVDYGSVIMSLATLCSNYDVVVVVVGCSGRSGS